jgi:hypothetical protein
MPAIDREYGPRAGWVQNRDGSAVDAEFFAEFGGARPDPAGDFGFEFIDPTFEFFDAFDPALQFVHFFFEAAYFRCP